MHQPRPHAGLSAVLTRAAPRDATRVGRAVCAGHHGELFQGQIEYRRGELRRCLVSLPCASLTSEAVLVLDPTEPLHVFPPHKIKARRVAELTAAFLRQPHLGGTLTITSDIAEGKGYGSSTADCVATVRAVAAAFGRRVPDREIARLCVQAEIASDNVMFEHAVLFAQREGIVLEDYHVPFPELEVIGIDVDPDGFVDTLAYRPAEYDWRQVQMFGTLSGALRRAFTSADLDLLGRVATASALANEAFLPKPCLAEVRSLAAAVHALGIASAHSGTLMSILLDPSDPLLPERMAFLCTELEQLRLGPVFRFRTAYGFY